MDANRSAESKTRAEPGKAGPDTRPVVLFDGECRLCSGVVVWIARRDRAARLRFGALQSEAGRRLLQRHGLPPPAPGEPNALPDSMVLVEPGGAGGAARISLRSAAAIGIGRRLGGIWALLAAIASLAPRCLRDPVYDFIARRRRRWFGSREACLVPSADLRRRFID